MYSCNIEKMPIKFKFTFISNVNLALKHNITLQNNVLKYFKQCVKQSDSSSKRLIDKEGRFKHI